MKKILLKIIPAVLLRYYRKYKAYISLVSAYKSDLKRYMAYSASYQTDLDETMLLGRIIANAHVIEKGLSFKEIKIGFGRDRVLELFRLIDLYIDSGFMIENKMLKSSLSIIEEYILFHKSKQYNIEEIEKKYLSYNVPKISSYGGVYEFQKQELIDKSKEDFETFAQYRFSVRNYSEEKVNMDLVMKAIKLAQKSPSVCNRQSTRVYIVNDKDKKREILDIHQGNRGFGHLADTLIIISSDLRVFYGESERNQPFTDSGLFSMSLMYSLFYYGLASCPINWNVDKKNDESLRKIVSIPENEQIIMIITVGNFPKQLSVAKSQRLDTNQIAVVI